MKKLTFPKNFLWGSATSSHQVEGGNKWNDWWVFEQGGKVANKDVSGKACDHYNRFEEDFALAKELGQNAHRFSIEWSRIEKEQGKWDMDEIEHYKKVLLSLKGKGFKTMVTLHHFTNPWWLSKIGGWENKKTPQFFAKYAQFIAQNLGQYVDFWVTINEPGAYISQGYSLGSWPPEKKSYLKAYKVFKNMVAAHKLVYVTIHQTNKDAKVGIAQNNNYWEPASLNSWLDRFVAKLSRYFASFWFLDKIKNHQDFVGLNYYFHDRIKFNLFRVKDFCFEVKNENRETSDLGWEIYPEGIYYTTKELWERYKKPIYITENGVADSKDKLRAEFILRHLNYIWKAIKEGVDCCGYFHWSLLDNFEWREGFSPRFGLIEVDYKTFKRKPRRSAYVYSKICKENYLMIK